MGLRIAKAIPRKAGENVSSEVFERCPRDWGDKEDIKAPVNEENTDKREKARNYCKGRDHRDENQDGDNNRKLPMGYHGFDDPSQVYQEKRKPKKKPQIAALCIAFSLCIAVSNGVIAIHATRSAFQGGKASDKSRALVMDSIKRAYHAGDSRGPEPSSVWADFSGVTRIRVILLGSLPCIFMRRPSKMISSPFFGTFPKK